MKLPVELICDIIRYIIDMPAVFIFDVDISAAPHPPILPQSRHICFKPCVNPPLQLHAQGQSEQKYPGTYESQVSKTIRGLLLTNKSIRAECLTHLHGIPVRYGAGNAIVRFNPRKHIICLQNITVSSPVYDRVRHRYTTWANRDPGLSTDFSFDIDHIAFMYLDHLCRGTPSVMRTFRRAFPTLQNFYCAVVDPFRKSHSEPLGMVCPDRDPAHGLSPVLVFILGRNRELMRGRCLVFRDKGRNYVDDDHRNLGMDLLILI